MDFDNTTYRIKSASAVFQKGIYHLFILKEEKDSDIFSRVLRLYQTLFQLAITSRLLDFNSSLNFKRDPPRRLRKYKQIDPAAIVTHSMFEDSGGKEFWPGFPSGHPLHMSSMNLLKLLARVVDARHNLMYRPFMLENFWEDCTLIDLLKTLPTITDAEQAYREFMKGMLDWHALEQQQEPKRQKMIEEYFANLSKYPASQQRPDIPPVWAKYFFERLFWVFEDRRNDRPTETLLLTYARMLNPDDEELLSFLKDYRSGLLDTKSLPPIIHLPEDWRVGEL